MRSRPQNAATAVLGVSARGIGDRMCLDRSVETEPVPLSRFIGPEKPRSDDGPGGSIFPRFPVASKASRSGFERGIGRDRRPPFPCWRLLGRLSPLVPVVADRPGSFLETVFGFSAIVLLAVPVVVGGGGPSGRVWEGATAPLPIERAVSEANSFAASRQSYPQAPRARIVVTI